MSLEGTIRGRFIISSTIKRLLFVLILVVTYLLIVGVWVGRSYGADLTGQLYWWLLIFSCWAAYNVGAFFFGWTIFGGPGGTIGPERDRFDRIGGAIVSAIASLIFMYFWIKELPII